MGYLEIDTIVRFDQGIKSDVYNALDIRLRFQFSFAYQKANSRNTVDFFKKIEDIYPLKQGIKIVQTNNGAEYWGESLTKILRRERLSITLSILVALRLMLSLIILFGAI